MSRSDMNSIRSDFLALTQKVFDQPLVYLDSAATTLKPKAVVERLQKYYNFETANVHRGAHFLSDRATEAFEAARITVKKFMNVGDDGEVIWTRGTTESINLVASSYVGMHLKAGDEIILSQLEHHSNVVPWQMVAEKKNLKIHFVPITATGDFDYAQFESLLSPKTKLVSVVHLSNAIGTIIDVKRIIKSAHNVGAKVLVDAAQTIATMPIDVQDLDCDFMAFSGHKLFGPYGIGVLFGKKDLLNEMQPYQGGGSMIDSVTEEKTTYLTAPHRFEAGTPNISGVLGLAAAIDYVSEIGFTNIIKHEHSLLRAAYERLSQLKDIQIYGLHATAPEKVANIISFNFKGAHASDMGHLLNQQGVAVRTGHHCNQILMKKLGVTGTIRASFSIYSNESDIERLVVGLEKARRIMNE